MKDLASKGPIVTMVKDVPAGFYGQIAGDHMYVRTNWKAPKWRVMEVDLKNPAMEKWREVRCRKATRCSKAFLCVGGKLAVRVTQDVSRT